MKIPKHAYFLALIALILLLVTSCMSVGFAVPQGMVFLGGRSVGMMARYDTIMVSSYEGSFSGLVFKVESNDIEIYNIIVTYTDGQWERLGTYLVFTAETRSRVLDLYGRNRRISSISFSSRTIGPWYREQTRVLVYGLRSAPVTQISIELQPAPHRIQGSTQGN